MRVVELKRRIRSGECLAPLPLLAREVLGCAPDDRQGLLRIAQRIRFDSRLSATLLESVKQPQGSIEDAVFHAGIGEIRRLVFQQAAMGLVPRTDGRLDRDVFWRHAFTCAELAGRLAAQRNSPWRSEAYVAGLLHDIGKLILDAAAPEGYSKTLDASHSHALYILEAEQRMLGVDHGLAGKWAAEYWNLPEAYMAALWLHHHPGNVLDGTLYPVDLIALIGLADQWAHGMLAGYSMDQIAAATEERRKPLGITREMMDAILPLEVVMSPELDDASPTPSPGLVEESLELSTRLLRHQALLHLHEDLQSASRQDEIVGAVAQCLRNELSLRAGCCYAVLFDALHGVVWSPAHPEPYPLRARLESGSEKERNILELLGSLLPNEMNAAALFHNHGLLVVPMMAHKGNQGQIIVDGLGSRLGNEDLDILLRVGRAAGMALERLLERTRREEHAEQWAAALWKQEMAHRQSIRAERMDTLAQLASGAAHTINNPLTAISGRAQMLLSRLNSPEDVRALETIIHQSRRISKILSNLMQFARPAEPRMETTVPSFVLHHVVGVLRERLEARHIRIFEHYAPGIPSIQADRQQLEQVFINLMINAEQAMPHGGDLTITVKPSPDRKSVVVQIADTGPGIPAEFMDRVFEPFFTTRDETENTGLGLAVCHGIIERHRGAIALHGSEGIGATCTITLPAFAEKAHGVTETVEPRQEPPAPHSRPPMEPLAAHIRPRVLIADPDEELREVVQQALQHRAYDVFTAADGLEALAIVFSKPLDVILLSPELTGPGGVPVLHQLRERRLSAPVIMLAQAGHSHGYESEASEGAAILVKPFPMERLLAALQQALSARHVA